MNLSKKQAIDADSRVTLQINFNANRDRPEDAIMFFIMKKQNKHKQCKDKYIKSTA